MDPQTVEALEAGIAAAQATADGAQETADGAVMKRASAVQPAGVGIRAQYVDDVDPSSTRTVTINGTTGMVSSEMVDDDLTRSVRIGQVVNPNGTIVRQDVADSYSYMVVRENSEAAYYQYSIDELKDSSVQLESRASDSACYIQMRSREKDTDGNWVKNQQVTIDANTWRLTLRRETWNPDTQQHDVESQATSLWDLVATAPQVIQATPVTNDICDVLWLRAVKTGYTVIIEGEIQTKRVGTIDTITKIASGLSAVTQGLTDTGRESVPGHAIGGSEPGDSGYRTVSIYPDGSVYLGAGTLIGKYYVSIVYSLAPNSTRGLMRGGLDVGETQDEWDEPEEPVEPVDEPKRDDDSR